jgi:hypothetical protein
MTLFAYRDHHLSLTGHMYHQYAFETCQVFLYYRCAATAVVVVVICFSVFLFLLYEMGP